MGMERQDRLAAMKRQVARQNEEWRRATAVLAEMNKDVEVHVADAVLARLEALRVVTPLATPVSGVRA